MMLALPDSLMQSARAVVAQTQRPIEAVLVAWFGRVTAILPIDQLPDNEVLALRDLKFAEEEQEELSDVLARKREGALSDPARVRLDAPMAMYERGMLHKARALSVAVERGLQSRLDAR